MNAGRLGARCLYTLATYIVCTGDEKRYYVCRERECPARAVADGNSTQQVTILPYHLGNENEVEVCKLKTFLRSQPVGENISFTDISEAK